MKLPFSFFLALRYLQPKRTFVSIITLISILGVTLGIMVLIIVMSVMTGFGNELRDKIIGFEPSIVVTNPNGILNDWRPLIPKIKAVKGVEGVAPYVDGEVLTEFHGTVSGANIHAIDVKTEKSVNDLRKFITAGAFDLNGEKVVIGNQLADKLGVGVGDKITVYGPGTIRSVLDEMQKESDNPGAKPKTLAELKGDMLLPQDLTVSGIFTSGRYQYDVGVVIMPLYLGQELYALEDGVRGLAVSVPNPYDAPKVKERLQQALGDRFVVTTWLETNGDLIGAIAMERNMQFFLLFFIVLVAAFGVMNTLITVTMQKTKEIGVMKALGATTWQIVWVFLGQGMVVGIFGNLAGVVSGIVLVQYRNEVKDWLSRVLHVQLFPQSVYQFSGIPAEIVPSNVAVICVSAFVICSLAALIPAYLAARLDPVKALRYE